MIRIWRSFSCNNSSASLLVARFDEPRSAQAASRELTDFLAAYAIEGDASPIDIDLADEPPMTAQRFAASHGFAWRGGLTWSGGVLTDHEPRVVVEGATLVIHHGYCSGLTDNLTPYLAARGAHEITSGRILMIAVTVLFAYRGGNRALDDELAAWSADGVTIYRDRRTVGVHRSLDPSELPLLRARLAHHDIAQIAVRICEPADQAMLAALATATCWSCGGALELWHPLLHDIAQPEVACTACGGMFDLATICDTRPAADDT